MLWLAVVGTFTVATLALIAITSLPQDRFAEAIGRVANDGTIESVSRFYDPLVERARRLTTLLFVLTIAAVGLRGPLLRFFAGVTRSIPPLMSQWRETLARWFRELGTSGFIAICVTLATGVALRIRFLGQPLVTDEAQTIVTYLWRPWHVALSWYQTTNNHPLNTLLSKAGMWATGDELWGARIPALLFGVLILPATYAFARQLYDKNVALMATALVVATAELVRYSTLTRGHTFVILSFLVIMIAADRLRRGGNALDWVVIGVLAAAGLYAVPTMIYPLSVAAVWVLLTRPRGQAKETLRGFGITFGVTSVLVLLAYLPILTVTGLSEMVSDPRGQPTEWGAFTSSLALMFENLTVLWTHGLPPLATFILLAGIVAATLGKSRTASESRRLLLAIAIGGALVLLLQRIALPSRIWLFSLPVFLTLASAGIVKLAGAVPSRWKSRWVPAAAAVSVALVSSLGLVRSGVMERHVSVGGLTDPDGLTDYFAANLAPTDAVVSGKRGAYPIRYYFREAGLAWDHLVPPLDREQDTGRAFLVVVTSLQTPQEAFESARQLRRVGDEVSPGPALVTLGNATVHELLPRPPDSFASSVATER